MSAQKSVTVLVIRGWQPGTRSFEVVESVNCLRLLPGDKTETAELALCIEDGIKVIMKRSGKIK